MDNPVRKGNHGALSKKAIAGLIFGTALLIGIIAAVIFVLTGRMQPDNAALAALEGDDKVQVVQQNDEIGGFGSLCDKGLA